MSNKPFKSSTPADLKRQILDPNVAKNEREWWAAREIERLRDENFGLLRAMESTLLPRYQVCTEHPFVHVTDPMGAALGCGKCEAERLRKQVDELKFQLAQGEWREHGFIVEENTRLENRVDELENWAKTAPDPHSRTMSQEKYELFILRYPGEPL